jgi:hypothetical protein
MRKPLVICISRIVQNKFRANDAAVFPVAAPLFSQQVPKHPEHEANRHPGGDQPQQLFLDYDCHGGDSPFPLLGV